MKHKYVLLRTTLGGASSNVAKVLVHAVPTYYFLLIRYIGILVLSFVFSKRNPLLDLKEAWAVKKTRKLLLISSFLYASANMLYYKALVELPVSIVPVLDNALTLLMTMGIAMMLGLERRGFKYYLPAFMLIPALGLILYEGGELPDGVTYIGLIYIVAFALCTSLDAVLMKEQLKTLPINATLLPKTLFTLISSIVFIIIYENKFSDLIAAMSIGVAALLLFNIFNSYLIRVLHAKSIQEIGVLQTGYFTALTPVMSILISIVVLGETLSIQQWLGIAMILGLLYKLKD